jgi:DNA mismatch repair ATPase MutS
VALLEQELFADLASFHSDRGSLIDELIDRFDEEVSFYPSYFEYMETHGKAGYPFCYPEIVPHGEAVYCLDSFDLALAERLSQEDGPVVLNDFSFAEGERILIVSGPNQGGKTTFARMVGQLCCFRRSDQSGRPHNEGHPKNCGWQGICRILGVGARACL